MSGASSASPADRRLRVLFCGTSGFAAPVLRALHRRHEVLAVVTQPDRPAGRGRRLRPSRIKQLAVELGLRVLQPPRLRRRAGWLPIVSLAPDCLVVADYGQILPARLLEAPPLGAVNVHASLLPQLRGAAPAVWAVARGLDRTGVTTMRMDAGLDTGPLLLQEAVGIAPGETGGSLLERLAPIGARLLLETLDGLAAGSLVPVPQDDAAATWAPRVERADTVLDWERPAAELEARVRAFAPAPGAFTAHEVAGAAKRRLLRIHSAETRARSVASENHPPGWSVVRGSGREARLEIACGDGNALVPLRVQPAGGRPMDAAAFLRGARSSDPSASLRLLPAAEAVELASGGNSS